MNLLAFCLVVCSVLSEYDIIYFAFVWVYSSADTPVYFSQAEWVRNNYPHSTPCWTHSATRSTNHFADTYLNNVKYLSTATLLIVSDRWTDGKHYKSVNMTCPFSSVSSSLFSLIFPDFKAIFISYFNVALSPFCLTFFFHCPVFHDAYTPTFSVLFSLVGFILTGVKSPPTFGYFSCKKIITFYKIRVPLPSGDL